MEWLQKIEYKFSARGVGAAIFNRRKERIKARIKEQSFAARSGIYANDEVT